MRNRLCYLRNYKAVCFNFLKTKPARALWTSGAKHLNMYSALGAEALLWMKLQRDLLNCGNKESRNWDYEEIYIIEIENKYHRVVEL